MIASPESRSPQTAPSTRHHRRDDSGIPEFLCRTPPLTASEECGLFRRLSELRSRCESTGDRRRLEDVRNRIVVANLRLLVSIAARFATTNRPLAEAVSDGIAPLIRAAELFDPSRGNRFSTYASHAIWNHLARIGRRNAVRQSREPATSPAILEAVVTRGENGVFNSSDREILALRPEELLRPILTERETLMIAARFGLGEFSREHKFREVAEIVGLSRERVRVLTRRALQKLREHLQIECGFAADPESSDESPETDFENVTAR